MRLVTYVRNDKEHVGAMTPSGVLELYQGDMIAFLKERSLRQGGAAGPTLSSRTVLKAPLPRPGKIIGLEMNYPAFIQDFHDHLVRSGMDVPDWGIPEVPWTFPKFPSSVIGSGQRIVRPRLAQKLDAEPELAVVIGRTGKQIPAAQALDYIAGFTIFNDVTDRGIELMMAPDVDHRLFTMAKNSETFGPMGPFLVTPDEVPEPHNLRIECRVNGEIVQEASTSDMIRKIPELIEFYSAFFTLTPGDVILTGAPGGCRGLRLAPTFLQPGDRVEIEIECLGVLENTIAEEEGSSQ